MCVCGEGEGDWITCWIWLFTDCHCTTEDGVLDQNWKVVDKGSGEWGGGSQNFQVSVESPGPYLDILGHRFSK